MSASMPPEPGPSSRTPLPLVTPRPTIWPAGLAFGITLSMWGLLTSLVLVVVGGAVFVISLVGWIGELRHAQERP